MPQQPVSFDTGLGSSNKCSLVPKSRKGWFLLVLLVGSVLIAIAEGLYFILAPCTTKTDLIVLLDSSGSIKSDDWQDVVNFTSAIIRHQDVVLDAKKGMRVAIHQFGKNQYTVSDFSTDADKLIEKLHNTTTKPQRTFTYNALKYINDTVLPAKRISATPVLFLLTDGNMSNMIDVNGTNIKCRPRIPDPVALEKCIEHLDDVSQTLRGKGVIIYTIGVAKYNLTELNVMNSGKEYLYTVKTFNELDEIVDDLTGSLCKPHYWLLSIPIGLGILVIIAIVVIDMHEVRLLKKSGEEAMNMRRTETRRLTARSDETLER